MTDEAYEQDDLAIIQEEEDDYDGPMTDDQTDAIINGSNFAEDYEDEIFTTVSLDTDPHRDPFGWDLADYIDWDSFDYND